MPKHKRSLYTIGYAGHTIESFIYALKANRVSILLDVRMTPISRKRGFSKSALKRTLHGAGIDYLHIRSLGSPASLRHALKLDGDLEAFFAGFRNYLSGQEASIYEASQLAMSRRACLMCVERCPNECHRSILADRIAAAIAYPFAVHHIAPI